MDKITILTTIAICGFGILCMLLGVLFRDDIGEFGRGYICLGVLVFGLGLAKFFFNDILEIPQKNKEIAGISSTEIFEHLILFEPYITDNPNIVTIDNSETHGFLGLKLNQIGQFYCSFFDESNTPVTAILDVKFAFPEGRNYFKIDIDNKSDGRNLVTVHPVKKGPMQKIILYSKTEKWDAAFLLATEEESDGDS